MHSALGIRSAHPRHPTVLADEADRPGAEVKPNAALLSHAVQKAGVERFAAALFRFRRIKSAPVFKRAARVGADVRANGRPVFVRRRNELRSRERPRTHSSEIRIKTSKPVKRIGRQRRPDPGIGRKHRIKPAVAKQICSPGSIVRRNVALEYRGIDASFRTLEHSGRKTRCRNMGFLRLLFKNCNRSTETRSVNCRRSPGSPQSDDDDVRSLRHFLPACCGGGGAGRLSRNGAGRARRYRRAEVRKHSAAADAALRRISLHRRPFFPKLPGMYGIILLERTHCRQPVFAGAKKRCGRDYPSRTPGA